MAMNPYLKDPSYLNVAAIPGQSLTETPGNRPYEKPAQFSEPEKALSVLVGELNKPKASKDVVRLLDAGITAETIASALVMQSFTEGVISPDVAEMLKEPLARFIIRIGLDNGVEDINVINEFPSSGMGVEDSIKMMSQLEPEKYERQIGQMREGMQEDSPPEMDTQPPPPEEEGFITRDRGM